MNFKTFLTVFYLGGIIALSLASCVRTPGEGGRASITGSVEIERRHQINNPESAEDTIPALDTEVFIVYGENTSPDDRVFTNPDGDFAFNWLRTGDYTIYVYSEDILTSSSPLPKVAISQSVIIDERDEVVVLETILIYDDY
jgi:hypothetical protein|tara:strand:+ start:172 stop:597 length:426 start_codon:yes stop_codon:yes gene_type:complete